MTGTACMLCGSEKNKKLFRKNSEDGKSFTLVCCKGCGLRFLHPRPSEEEIKDYYGKNYFTRRTERGYDNYFSDKLKNEIQRLIGLNLYDLKLLEYEKELNSKKSVLDIGCAAGYFVDYMSRRGWKACGIDISKECVDFAVKKLKLDVQRGSYLDTNFREKFNLITLWATIEHLHHPDMFIKKIHDDLEKDGILFISTCRIGGLNFMKLFGKKWRYYNFPEHLYFFSFRTIKMLLEKYGFRIVNSAVYGSGVGKGSSKLRKVADFLAKKYRMGDMMLISARKEN